jgi:hypothetical protein
MAHTLTMPPRRSSARGSNAGTAVQVDHQQTHATPNPRKRPANVNADEGELFPTAEERKRRKKDVSGHVDIRWACADPQTKKQRE